MGNPETPSEEKAGGNEENLTARTNSGMADEQYRALQSKVDSMAAEKERLEMKLKSRMDEEAREKYELQEENSRLHDSLERKDMELRKQENKFYEAATADVRNKLISEKYPHLKQWGNSFAGKNEEELDKHMKEASDELRKFLSSNEGKSFATQSSSGMESSKSAMSETGPINIEDFKKLPLKDKRRIVKNFSFSHSS